MTEVLTWIAESGERLTVVSLLLLCLFVLVYGVQKKQRWWVPGWMLTDCEAENERLEAEIKVYVERTQRRLDILEDVTDRDRRRRGDE